MRRALEEGGGEEGAAVSWGMGLVALRCMEARGLIEAPGFFSHPNSRRVKRAVERAFSARARQLPALFDLPQPAPGEAALQQACAVLRGCALELFEADEALGWAYQLWNSEERGRLFRGARGKKLEGEELVTATQLYTEPYMVRFLLQHSLGELWRSGRPASEIRVFDPACGTGHFLLHAFDLLFEMYRDEGTVADAGEIGEAILDHNLFGADIDGRAVAIAEAALWMKVRERAPGFGGGRSNLVALNAEGELLGSLAPVRGRDFVHEHVHEHEYVHGASRVGRVLGGRYDVVTGNPPYLYRRHMGKGLKEALERLYPDGAADLFAAFASRCFSMVAEGGYLALVLQQSLLFLATYEDLRRRLIAGSGAWVCAHLGARAFQDISGEKVNTVLAVIPRQATGQQDEKPSTFFRLTHVREKAKALEEQRAEDRFDVPLGRFDAIDGAPLAYWLPEKVLRAFSMSALASLDVRNGINTHANARFLRRVQEVTPEQLGETHRLYVKGGTSQPWSGGLSWVIEWENDGERLREFVRSRGWTLSYAIYNERYFCRRCLTYNATTGGSFYVRQVPPEAIFDCKGPCLFSANDDQAVLHFYAAYLNSAVARLILGALNPTVEYQVGDLKRLPLPAELLEPRRPELAKLGARAIGLSRQLTATQLMEHDFEVGMLAHTLRRGRQGTIGEALAAATSRAEGVADELEAVEAEIDGVVFEAFGLDGDERLRVTREVGRDGSRRRLRKLRCPSPKALLQAYLVEAALRLVGHRWPRDGEDRPAKAAGIVPLTEVGQHVVRGLELALGGRPADIERGCSDVLGAGLEQWLAKRLFRQQVKLLQRRPAAWQLQSEGRRPAFACLVGYHALDEATLPTIRARFVAPLMESADAATRVELQAFDAKLRTVEAEGFACTGVNGDDAAYRPDPADGVRVNIAPLQRAGLLAAEVLPERDVERAIEERAEWRGLGTSKRSG